MVPLSIIINDILGCIDHIDSYTSKLSFDDFSSNYMVIEACLYNVQVIGPLGTHQGNAE